MKFPRFPLISKNRLPRFPRISKNRLNTSVEHNLTNIFLEKAYTKCGRKTIPVPFSEKSKLSISLDQ